MSEEDGVTGLAALHALLALPAVVTAVADKEWGAAAGMIVKKLLLSAGQTPESLAPVQAAVGEELFNAQLKSLTHHQARQLARRLDKRVPDFEVSTASAANAHVRKLLAAVKLPEPEIAPEIGPEIAPEIEPETAPEPEALPETLAVKTPGPEEKLQAPAEDKVEPKEDAWGAGALSLTDEADAETTPEEKADADPASPPPPPPPGSAYFGRKSFRT